MLITVIELSKMLTRKSVSLITLRNYELVKVFILLAITVWIAHFWYSASFGLYEDDYSRVSRAMGMTFSELWNVILTTSYYQGRPLHDTFIFLFSFLGAKLGGLQALYWIAYLIFTLNAFLFYLLLKRLFDHQFFTVTGALAFCLFPADTTQTWLTVAFGIQTSLTFLLLALHCYLSSRQKLSYLFAFCCLLTYETFFPVFFAAPLLKEGWNSKRIQELFRHALILGSMIVCVVIIRKIFIGTTGVMSIGLLSARTSIRLMIYGPIISIGMFLLRPIDTLILWDFRNSSVQYIPWSVARNIFVLFLAPCFAGLWWVLYQLKSKTLEGASVFRTSIRSKVFSLELEIPEFFKHLAKLALVGLILSILAYPLALTMSPTTISGRDTRIHLPAAIGVSILWACASSAILFIANIYRKKRLATFGLATFFTLLIGFGLVVQYDYQTSWQYQRAFWTDVIRLSPDINDGTKIFVEKTGLKSPNQISANSWPAYYILDQIYQFPSDWKTIPRLFLLPSGWEEDIVSDKNLFYLKNSIAGDDHSKFKSSNVILLKIKNGKLIRETAPLIIEGKVFSLKQVSASEPIPLRKGQLYDYLTVNSDEENVDYILN